MILTLPNAATLGTMPLPSELLGSIYPNHNTVSGVLQAKSRVPFLCFVSNPKPSHGPTQTVSSSPFIDFREGLFLPHETSEAVEITGVP